MNFTKCLLIVAIGLYWFLSASINVSAAHYFPTATQAAANVNMAPFYWIVGIVGGSIAVTLSYVSWRKYRGERKKQTEDDSNN